MSTRFAWLLGVVVLVSIGLLVACGSTYSASSDGLVVVGSQGSALLQTYSFNLSNGHIANIYNSVGSTSALTCVLPGIPSSIVLDPAGAYAYTIVTANSGCPPPGQTGIAAFKINSDGSLKAGTITADPNPVAIAMDSAGKFLFVAEGLGGAVESFAIGSDASLTLVPGTFNFPSTGFAPNFVALAATPTVFPPVGLNGVQNAVCSAPGTNAPTSEFLYVVDQSNNNKVWEFGVDTSTGALVNPPGYSEVQPFPVGSVPTGVAVDPCDRFVYVTNLLNNNISAFSICNATSTQSQGCTVYNPPLAGGDGTLIKIFGSPFSVSGGANGPGPLAVDPFGNNLYVLDTLSSMISIFHISPVSGSLTVATPAIVATGTEPRSLAIRGDDNWLFVANYGSASLSQYAIIPATGALTAQPTVDVDNSPWGVAVK